MAIHCRAVKSSLRGTGLVISQVPKRLFPAFVAPLLCSSLRNVGNADLFFLLALQQACQEGIAHLQYPSGCAVWCLFRLWVGLADRCLGPTRAQLKGESRSALLPMPPPSSAHPRALGPAPLDFAMCRLAKEPSPAELELK